jgi:hypothetical protein
MNRHSACGPQGLTGLAAKLCFAKSIGLPPPQHPASPAALPPFLRTGAATLASLSSRENPALLGQGTVVTGLPAAMQGWQPS